MRKIFFALLLAIVGTTMAMAYNYGYRKVDYVPDVGHFTWNHHLDQSDNKFYFTDNYHLGVGVERKYIVHVYERKPGQSSIIVAYRMDKPSDCWYHYGVLTPNGISENEIGQEEYINSYDFSEFDDEGHTGGDMCIDLSDVIQKAKQQNYTELRIVVEELTREKWQFRSWYPVETESRSDCGRGLFHNNYLDVDLPVVQVCDIQASSPKVKYGDNFDVTALYKASHPARLTIQYTDAEGPTYPDSVWVDLAQKTLTADEAKKGCQFVYKRAFTQNGMPAERRYRLKAVDQVRGTTQYSGMETVEYFYQLERENVVGGHQRPGYHIQLGFPATGKQFLITSDIPVNLTETTNGFEFDMPACNVRVQEMNKIYTVRFFDYDYTLLKEQQVGEGRNATPPTTPTHAGMTFKGWNGEYTNIQANTVLRAVYEVNGIEGQVYIPTSYDEVAQGETVELCVRVKSSASVGIRAYVQTAWLDNENDVIQWPTAGMESMSFDFSASEAAAGTGKSQNVKILSTGSLNYGHRARYFRLRLRVSGSSTDIYSDVLRVDTYYPITVNVGEYTGIHTSCMTSNRYKNSFWDNGTVYARPGDTIWAANTHNCDLNMTLAMGSTDAIKGSNDGNFYIVMPAGYGENTLSLAPAKHTVLFYAEGHIDGWYNLEYGDGVYEPQEITCGGMATPPELGEDVLTGNVFHGWQARGNYANDAYMNVKEPMAFDAILESVPTYTVTFKDWDGSVLDQQEVAIGESAMPPLVENREGYDFIGWDQDFSAVTTPMTVIAQYEAWPESIEDIVAPVDKARKYLINGEIYIANPDGKIYNAQGAQVK